MIKIIFSILILTTSSTSFGLSYNEAQSKASHNSYQRDISLWDQLTIHKFQAIEFDLHTTKILKSAPKGDWFVYHHLLDRSSQFNHFSDGLDELVKYQKSYPEHDVLTVFLDTSGFNENHSVEMFNQLLNQKLGPYIYTPQMLKSDCQNLDSLQKSVEECSWPQIENLKGKILFVLTKGNLAQYINQSKKTMAFVASKPNNIIPDSVFMNIKYDKNVEGLDDLKKKNIITRFYFVEGKDEFIDALNKFINFIAIDDVDSKKFPWQDLQKK